MKIACLSGKGGAGKTMISVNLAVCAGADTYIDCDVEAPNGRIFFKPEQVSSQSVTVLLPEFDAKRCDGCKQCVESCRFHALMYIKDTPRVFAEVCHSCGLCAMVCPQGAVTEAPRSLGTVEIGSYRDIKIVTGALDPGEATGVAIIRRALKEARGLTVIDCPPGSACSVMECVMDADYCLLVAEPTVFGFHNFQMVHQLATLLGKPCGVVINKQLEPYAPLEDYCAERGLPILARIPYDPGLAAATASGRIAGNDDPTLFSVFQDMGKRIGGGA